MDCSSKNVIYLITCRKCGIQYVGKTSQTQRSRMNNYRNRLKQLANIYIYNHFNSDGHYLDDISIMPIEAVLHSPGDTTTIGSKLLSREEFWYRELGSIYPYGLNDNVRGLVMMRGGERGREGERGGERGREGEGGRGREREGEGGRGRERGKGEREEEREGRERGKEGRERERERGKGERGREGRERKRERGKGEKEGEREGRERWREGREREREGEREERERKREIFRLKI